MAVFSDLYPMFAYHISSEISIYVHENAKGKALAKRCCKCCYRLHRFVKFAKSLPKFLHTIRQVCSYLKNLALSSGAIYPKCVI